MISYCEAAGAGALAPDAVDDGVVTEGVVIPAASGAWVGAGAGIAGTTGVEAGALMAVGSAMGPTGAACTVPPWNFIIKGTISSATMLMILIKGLMAGPAVSL